jgi:hypothetical protein
MVYLSATFKFFHVNQLLKFLLNCSTLSTTFSRPSKIQLTIDGPIIDPEGTPCFGIHLIELDDFLKNDPQTGAFSQAFKKYRYLLHKGYICKIMSWFMLSKQL